jgi:hypothetical protein
MQTWGKNIPRKGKASAAFESEEMWLTSEITRPVCQNSASAENKVVKQGRQRKQEVARGQTTGAYN